MNKKEILQSMLIDEEEIFKELVNKAQKIFKLDQHGNAIFLVPLDSLTQRQFIAMQLLGRYFANELEITDSDVITADELSVQLHADKKSVTARLHELKKERIIESPGRGQFRISISGAEKILDEILHELN
jgi:hypothetical protein